MLSGSRPVESRDHAQTGGLPRTRRSQHGKELTIMYLEIGLVNRFYFPKMSAYFIESYGWR
jgi:hypothetical protein